MIASYQSSDSATSSISSTTNPPISTLAFHSPVRSKQQTYKERPRRRSSTPKYDNSASIGSYTSALHESGQIKLLRPGLRIDRVLTIVGLRNVFEVFDDEATALLSFDPKTKYVKAPQL